MSTIKIIKTNYKGGCYVSDFTVRGICKKGRDTTFTIGFGRAKNFKEAIAYWKKIWGKECIAHSIQRSAPLSEDIPYLA